MSEPGPPLTEKLRANYGDWDRDVIDIRRKDEWVEERSLKVSFKRTIRVATTLLRVIYHPASALFRYTAFPSIKTATPSHQR